MMNQEEKTEENLDFQKEDKSQRVEEICHLCKRNRPVFTGDDQLRRLPESTLSPFLKQLKIDSKAKQRYLQQLRITPKFIKSCKCKKSQSYVHIYCKTAHIIQTRKIFCDKCDAYFELHLLKKSISIFGNLSKYLAVIVLVSAVVYGFFLFDGTIKC